MTLDENLIVVFSFVLSGVAALTNWYAARVFHGWLRAALMVTAFQATLYCISYTWLFFHPDQSAEWSSTMRPVGMASWLVPWAFTPYFLMRYVRSASADLHLLADQLEGQE